MKSLAVNFGSSFENSLIMPFVLINLMGIGAPLEALAPTADAPDMLRFGMLAVGGV